MAVQFYLFALSTLVGSYQIAEKTLIFFSVFGIFGALLGMKVFHHKTKKNSFYAWIWLIFAVELILFGYCLYKKGFI